MTTIVIIALSVLLVFMATLVWHNRNLFKDEQELRQQQVSQLGTDLYHAERAITAGDNIIALLNEAADELRIQLRTQQDEQHSTLIEFGALQEQHITLLLEYGSLKEMQALLWTRATVLFEQEQADLEWNNHLEEIENPMVQQGELDFDSVIHTQECGE